jgi:hypothetical protein
VAFKQHLSALSPEHRLRLLLGLVILGGVLAAIGAILTGHLGSSIGGAQGLLFWVVVVALGSAAPVRMPSGAVVDVTIAAIVAAAILGGPVAAAVVAVGGTVELRELKGLVPGRRDGIPWYGTLYNHAALTIAAVVCAALYAMLNAGVFSPTASSLAAVVAAGLAYALISNSLAALAVAVMQDRRPGKVFMANIRQFGISLAGLTAVAWLMAVMYIVAGPIGILPFAVPLFATRSGYQKVVEIRDMFTQTVRSLSSAVDAKDPYTAGHSERVQLIARSLGEEMGCTDSEL